MSYGTGQITQTKTSFNGNDINLQVEIFNDSAYSQTVVPVIQPSGFFGIPFQNDKAFIGYTPYGSTGAIIGYGHCLQNKDNFLTGIGRGECSMFSNRGKYTLQAKLDKIYAHFKSNNQEIQTTLLINENVITILQDIIAEIKALENDYNSLKQSFQTFANTHVHIGVQSGNNNSGTAIPVIIEQQYNETSNFKRDDSFINSSPNPMYVNNNGKVIS